MLAAALCNRIVLILLFFEDLRFRIYRIVILRLLFMSMELCLTIKERTSGEGVR